MTVADLPPGGSPQNERPRKMWTRAECRHIADLGGLPGERRYELIEGDLLERMGQNQPHVFVLFLVCQALIAAFGADFVQSQAPVAINETNEPEPDAFVTRNTQRYYFDHNTPTPEEIRLVVEVSDTTFWFDTTVKANLYSRAAIPEYWVVDVSSRALIVHRNPGPDGYADRRIATDADLVAPLSAPDRPIRVSDLLP